MQESSKNQIGGPSQAKRIHFFIFALLTLFQPALVSADSLQGQLKGLSISDSGGQNSPPTSVIQYNQSGSTFTFDGSVSADSDGNIAQYKWDFGDGGAATTAVAQHQFLAQGQAANVTLSVVDDKGAIALSRVSLVVPVVYEDAEDESIGRWAVYDNDPAGATVTNVFDQERNSRVIVLTGSLDTSNGYKLTKIGGALWGNTKNFILQWSLKYATNYEVFIDCQTNAGHRYLKYSTATSSTLGTGETVNYGLGTTTKNGQWQTITRDLAADLKTAQPTVQLMSINGFMIRGTGRVDDIMLR